MNRPYPYLFSPIKIGPLMIKNRIEGAPMGFSDSHPDGTFAKENVAMYRAFAQGGAGIVTVGETTVDTWTGQAHDRTMPLDNRDMLPSLLEVSDAIKQHGAVPSIELIHPGHWANPQYTKGPHVYSASAGIHHRYGQDYQALAMDEDMIERVVESYAKAAYLAKVGGFEMCMVHGAHGWLISQFLSPTENHRKDRFGGSLENRARLALMVVEQIRRQCGPDFPIEFRLSGKEFAAGAIELAESIEFARMLDGKVDLIHVSVSTFSQKNTVPRMFPTMFMPHGCNADIAATIKQAVKTPVVTVGRLGDPELMEELLAEGKADMVAMVRGLMADPQLPRKAKEGRSDEIVPCLRCNTCLSETFVSLLPYASRSMKCAVNPTCGREFQAKLFEKPRRSYRVLVAGGGPAGMEAALIAAQRGHEVFLCEKSARLGGALLATEHVSFKQDIGKFRQSLINRLSCEKVKVMLQTAVNADLVKSLHPDILIAALGADSVKQGIIGIERSNVINVEDIRDHEQALGPKIVVVGGGMSGVEEALHLAMLGKEVTVLEMGETIAKDGNFRGREALLQEMADYCSNLKAYTGMKALEITAAGVVAENWQGQKESFAADQVVIAIGRVARTEEAESLRDLAPEFVAIGDCRKVGKIFDAIHSAYNAAMNIY